MINHLSRKITCFFIGKNAIQETEKEVYEYCFEILLSTLINMAVIIIGAICTKTYVTSLIFVIVFMTMRACSGGYHADTHLRCFFILVFVYTGMIVSLKLVDSLMIYGLTLNIVSGIVYLAVSPVEHLNNPMSKEKKHYLRIKSNVISLLLIVMSSVLLSFKKMEKIGFALSYANACVAISCLCAVIKKQICKHPKT